MKKNKKIIKFNKQGNKMKKAKIITVTSGKGGVGKTTTTANIATALAENGFKILTIDFDIGLRNLDMILGLESRVVYNIIDLMNEEVSKTQAIVTSKENKNLSFLAASQTHDKNALCLDKIKKLLSELQKDYDYIFIDSPAGIEAGFEHSMVLADMALIVVNPELSSIRDSDKIIGLIDAKSEKARNGAEVIKKAIINRYDIKMVEKGDMIDIESLQGFLGIDILGIVPDERKTISASNIGKPIYHEKELQISHAYGRIAKRLANDEILEPTEWNVLENLQNGAFDAFIKMFKIG